MHQQADAHYMTGPASVLTQDGILVYQENICSWEILKLSDFVFIGWRNTPSCDFTGWRNMYMLWYIKKIGCVQSF